MNFKDKFVIIFLLVGISFTTVSCLKCHVCNTINKGEEDCESIADTNTKYLQDCSAPFNQSCRLQEQWVDFEVLEQQPNKRTIRQCASTPFDPQRLCYYRAGFGGKVNICNCIGDGCNEASRTASTIFITIALFLIVGWLS